MRFSFRRFLMAFICALAVLMPSEGHAQERVQDPEPLIEATDVKPTDQKVQTRLESIFAQIDDLSEVQVRVAEGVVTLRGEVSNDAQAVRAIDLAIRTEGVVTVEDKIERVLDIEGNVTPVIDNFQELMSKAKRALPLLGLALFVFAAIAWVGHLFAKWTAFWQKIAPNPFLAELMSQAVRVIFILLAIVLSLSLLGATALMGTILGGAGVLGIAISFAVRDTLENYISSIMLSLRQPFRSGDLVDIDGRVGVVARLTSRATILMTTDGNHLRIPNADVFKAVILNYTRNPERRFDFELGVDADDDPLEAMKTGLDAIKELPFILEKPEASSKIQQVGDSNIVIWFGAWVDQSETDFGKARSLAIRAAKEALEASGFTLPEPIYRLRLNQLPATLSSTVPAAPKETPQATRPPKPLSAEDMDVAPDEHLEEKVMQENAENAENSDANLLDDGRPTE